MQQRRGLLAIGFVLMVLNKLTGTYCLISKFLIDNVVTKQQTDLLRPLVAAVLTATLIQGVTSFSLTQCCRKRRNVDRGTAAEGAEQSGGASLLRRQQDRHSGLAHHERTWRACETSSARAWWILSAAFSLQRCAGCWRASAHQ